MSVDSVILDIALDYLTNIGNEKRKQSELRKYKWQVNGFTLELLLLYYTDSSNKGSFIDVIVQMHQKVGDIFEDHFNVIRDLNMRINQEIDDISRLIEEEEAKNKELLGRQKVLENILSDFMSSLQSSITSNKTQRTS